MAFRSRNRGRSPRKPRDLIWVNKIVEIAWTDAGVVGGDIMDSTNWAINTAFDRATLLAIKGVVSWTQSSNATTGDAPFLAWAFYKDAGGLTTGLMDPAAATGTEAFDILHWSHAALQGTASTTNAPIQREAVDIKVKRKLTSGDSIYLVARCPADTVSPTGNLIAQLRFLIDRG